jgi:IclR family KDG regulon transcriptional repressor
MEGETSLTIARAMQLLCSFSAEESEFGISELSRKLGLSKTAVFRMVHTLEQYEFLEKNRLSGKYCIGRQAFRTGNLFGNLQAVERKLEPFMRELVESTKFSCYLSTLRGHEMVILANMSGSGPLRHSIPIGEMLPAHSSATGKAALATLEDVELERLLKKISLSRRTANTLTSIDRLRQNIQQVRKAGYSINWEENTPGVASVAAPIRDEMGYAMVVISLGFATSQVRRDGMPALGEKLKRTAAQAARYLGVRARKAA